MAKDPDRNRRRDWDRIMQVNPENDPELVTGPQPEPELVTKPPLMAGAEVPTSPKDPLGGPGLAIERGSEKLYNWGYEQTGIPGAVKDVNETLLNSARVQAMDELGPGALPKDIERRTQQNYEDLLHEDLTGLLFADGGATTEAIVGAATGLFGTAGPSMAKQAKRLGKATQRGASSVNYPKDVPAEAKRYADVPRERLGRVIESDNKYLDRLKEQYRDHLDIQHMKHSLLEEGYDTYQRPNHLDNLVRYSRKEEGVPTQEWMDFKREIRPSIKQNAFTLDAKREKIREALRMNEKEFREALTSETMDSANRAAYMSARKGLSPEEFAEWQTTFAPTGPQWPDKYSELFQLLNQGYMRK